MKNPRKSLDEAFFFLHLRSPLGETLLGTKLQKEYRMKISWLLCLAFYLAMFSGCGNRYYKNYNGERFSKTKWCNLISAEVEYYSTGRTLEELVEHYKSKDSRMIGMGFYNGRNLNAKHQKKIVKACRAIGGNAAIFGSNKIFYFREVENESSDEDDENEDFRECAARSDYIKSARLCDKSFFHARGFYWNPIAEKCELFRGRTETVEEICALADESSRPSD